MEGESMEVVAGWLLTSKYLNSSKLFSLKESTETELPVLRQAETFCTRQTCGSLVLIGGYPTPIRIFYLGATDAAVIGFPFSINISIEIDVECEKERFWIGHT
jgi:hypothetical protein